MNRGLISLLVCPATGEHLELAEAKEADGRVTEGELRSVSGCRYPIVNSIPRFVRSDNYAASFGLQWNRFRSTQLDSVSGIPISRDRFFAYSKWLPDQLRGKRVLDVGCGAGRFTEIALASGARVTAIDYSSAVDACWANLGPHPDLDVLQADLFHMPLVTGRFDYVYCFGVLQHTPDPAGAFDSVARQVAPGGGLAVDVYPWLLRNLFWSKYWLRPMTRRIRDERLFEAVERFVPALLPASDFLAGVPVAGRYLRYLLPVANYSGVYPLNELQRKEWAVLDTFDMLSPRHDHPQRASTLRSWFASSGFTDFSVERLGFLVGRGVRDLPGTGSQTQGERSHAHSVG